ncbi:disease resistance protein RPV1-like [Eucalyptus grandis]|uniref:disease resistance protein RPV1-like n=1 Tax=Eucalyptus grandis TaxID=71139 RepID=UPI00192E82DF|nr:disease resistance protein RPV1-like [Eucalyptus grandis]
MRALDVSKIYVPIFSKDYASSSWCLREVAHMVDCVARLKGNKEILPVFFDASPSDVKLRTGLYRNAMAKHRKKFGVEEVKRWEDAFVEVAELKGWDLKTRGMYNLNSSVFAIFCIGKISGNFDGSILVVSNQLSKLMSLDNLYYVPHFDGPFISVRICGKHGEAIKLIIREVLVKLKIKHKYVKNQLVGVDDCVEDIMKLLDVDCEGVCFVETVVDILDSRFVDNIHDIDDGINQIGTRFRNKKVIIVLDDVDKEEQLEKKDYPPYQYHIPTSEIVVTTKGLPLALEVIGSFLYRQPEKIWKETMERLRKKKVQALILTGSDYQPLVITHDELSRLPNLRFLELEEGTFAKDFGDDFSKLRWISWYSPRPLDLEMAKNLKVLNLRGCEGITRTPNFSACFSLERLSFYNCINLVEIDPSIWKLKRLIHLNLKECLSLKDLPEEIGRLTNLKLLASSGCFLELPGSLKELDLSNIQIECLLDCSGDKKFMFVLILSSEYVLKASSYLLPSSSLGWIRRLSKLKKLELSLSSVPAPPTKFGSLPRLTELILSGLDLEYITKLPPSLLELRLVNFNSIISWSIFSNLKNLSKLRLSQSQLQEIELSGLEELRALSVTNCELLQRLFISTRLKKLKELWLSECLKLVEIEGLEALEFLEEMNVQYCGSVERLYELSNSKLLKLLVISDCYELRTVEGLNGLESLNALLVCECSSLEKLIIPSKVEKLTHLEVSGCEKLIEIPGLVASESLETLTIKKCPISKICELSNLQMLKSLSIVGCHERQSIDGVDELDFLCDFYVSSCRKLEALLDESNTKLSDECLITIRKCRKLQSHGYPNVNGLPYRDYKDMIIAKTNSPTGSLPLETSDEKLLILNLSRSSVTKYPQEWRQLMEGIIEVFSFNQFGDIDNGRLYTVTCTLGVHQATEVLEILEFEKLQGSPAADPTTEWQGIFYRTSDIVEIHIENNSLRNLEVLSARNCKKLKDISPIGHLTKLKCLALDGANIDWVLETFDFPLKLERLSLRKCEKLCELPSSIGKLKELEEMDLSDTRITQLPESVNYLSNLKTLKMERTPLQKFPKDIVKLEKLEEIDFFGCTNLEAQDSCDISGLSSLKILRLSSSIVAGLPRGICGLPLSEPLTYVNVNDFKHYQSCPPV